MDEGFDANEDLLKDAKGMLVTPFIAVDVVIAILIAIGGIVIIGVFVEMCISKKRKNPIILKS